MQMSCAALRRNVRPCCARVLSCSPASCITHPKPQVHIHQQLVTRDKRQRHHVSASAMPVGDMALINVDYISPSLWLGVAVATSGLVLYAFKMQNARGTEDLDIVTSSLLILVGGILMLQGWRLDPILMLSEGVLALVGVYYIVQTVELRKQIMGQYEEDVYDPRMYDPRVSQPENEEVPPTWRLAPPDRPMYYDDANYDSNARNESYASPSGQDDPRNDDGYWPRESRRNDTRYDSEPYYQQYESTSSSREQSYDGMPSDARYDQTQSPNEVTWPPNSPRVPALPFQVDRQAPSAPPQEWSEARRGGTAQKGQTGESWADQWGEWGAPRQGRDGSPDEWYSRRR